MCWVFLVIYGLLLALASRIHVSLVEWLAVWTVLAVAWSVMERKRWGRFALLGIAIILLINLVVALWQLQSIPPSLIQTTFVGQYGPMMVLHNFLRGTLFGSSSLLLAPITALWLMRQKVKSEFEHCKKIATNRYQLYIAMFLLSLCAFGIVEDSASRWTHVLRQTQVNQRHPLLITKVPRTMKHRSLPIYPLYVYERRRS
jgi:hypothetical protein